VGNSASGHNAAANAFGTPTGQAPWYGAVALLVALVLFLVAHTLSGSSAPSWLPTHLPDCNTAGITAAGGREGICSDAATIFGGGTVYNVVDAGHTLRMPGFDVRLLGFRVAPTTVTNAQIDPEDYPNDQGQLVSVEVAVTNEGAAPLVFDRTGSDDDLVIPDLQGPDPAIAIVELVDPSGAPGVSIAQQGPVASHGTITGWISFVAPDWAASVIHQPGSDVEFYVPGDLARQYVGQLRLWKAATAQAGAELGITSPASTLPAEPTISAAAPTTTTTITTATSPWPRVPPPVQLRGPNIDPSRSPDASRPVPATAAEATPQWTSAGVARCPAAAAPAPSASLNRAWLRFVTLLDQAACSPRYDTASQRREIARMMSAQSCYLAAPIRSSKAQDRYYCGQELQQLIQQAEENPIPDQLLNLELIDGRRAYCDVNGLGNVRLIRHGDSWWATQL
jgi:hypothetical protein